MPMSNLNYCSVVHTMCDECVTSHKALLSTSRDRGQRQSSLVRYLSVSHAIRMATISQMMRGFRLPLRYFKSVPARGARGRRRLGATLLVRHNARVRVHAALPATAVRPAPCGDTPDDTSHNDNARTMRVARRVLLRYDTYMRGGLARNKENQGF